MNKETKEKFWKFMDSAKGFWTLILSLVVVGIGYMVGASKIIEGMIKRRRSP
jgi:hypothetical protein